MTAEFRGSKRPGSQITPKAEFGLGQIFAPAKSAYMPSLAISKATTNRQERRFAQRMLLEGLDTGMCLMNIHW